MQWVQIKRIWKGLEKEINDIHQKHKSINREGLYETFFITDKVTIIRHLIINNVRDEELFGASLFVMKRKKKRKALYDMDAKRDTLLLGEVVKKFAVKYNYLIFLTSKNRVIMKKTYS